MTRSYPEAACSYLYTIDFSMKLLSSCILQLWGLVSSFQEAACQNFLFIVFGMQLLGRYERIQTFGSFWVGLTTNLSVGSRASYELFLFQILVVARKLRAPTCTLQILV
eukprot:TRINITY_DN2596_c1_g1_i1.p9 TRINITY_DN2596_c1_g1~~TRINITY_DN2596_c1_g1_i1.p9  ORF type:complete len:109 (+),score=3.56 TRINITY_DN2596_c1_g1_i1:1047-1373(+)